MITRHGMPIFGEHEAKTLDQLYDVANRAERASASAAPSSEGSLIRRGS